MGKPLILTFTGKELDPLNLAQEDICIEDIAHALANCNRFAGHTRRPINVAQHSVYVSRLCDDDLPVVISQTRSVALQGLLHDGSEAYLGDITKWLKAKPEFAAYREAEDTIQRAIYQKFGCELEMSPIVAAADKLMLRFEGELGFGNRAWMRWLQNITYDPITPAEALRIGSWDFWSWRQSEEAFLTQFRILTAMEA